MPSSKLCKDSGQGGVKVGLLRPEAAHEPTDTVPSQRLGAKGAWGHCPPAP